MVAINSPEGQYLAACLPWRYCHSDVLPPEKGHANEMEWNKSVSSGGSCHCCCGVWDCCCLRPQRAGAAHKSVKHAMIACAADHHKLPFVITWAGEQLDCEGTKRWPPR